MPEIYFENASTGKRYAVVKFDREAGTVTLKGPNAEFVQKYDKALFQNLGYELKQA